MSFWSRITAVMKRVGKLKTELAEARNSVEELTEQLEALRSSALTQEESTKLRDSLRSAKDRVSELGNEVLDLRSKIDTKDQRIAQLGTSLATTTTELDQLKAEYQRAVESLESMLPPEVEDGTVGVQGTDGSEGEDGVGKAASQD